MINGSSLWALSERKAAKMSLRRLGLLLLLPVVFSQGWSPGHLLGLHHLVASERKNRETTEPAALRNNVLRRSLGQSHVKIVIEYRSYLDADSCVAVTKSFRRKVSFY